MMQIHYRIPGRGVLFLLVVLTLYIGIQVSPARAASPEPVYGTQGMVVSRSSQASAAGLDILRQGGNAIDAAVATGFALAVTYPSAGNLAGGGFAVVHLQDGSVITLDHRETAPKSAHRDMYLDDKGEIIRGMSRQSRASSGVPGSVAGLLALQERYGTMTRQQVMAPAIHLAEAGFELDHDLADQFNGVSRSMQEFPSSMQIFTNDGQPYAAGDTWIQSDLAKTLKLIAENGRDGFYAGETARLIVAEMAKGNGLISMQDLSEYQPVWREPVTSKYRGYDVYGMPPASSGGVLIAMMLNMLQPYDLKAMGWGSAEFIHLMVEVERRAYADRTQHLGDMDFYPVPLQQLVSMEYASNRMANFDPARASRSDDIGPGSWPAESPETTHYSVLDAAGNAVALTTTLNSGYGNKIVVSGGGFLLNNEMDDFSIKENTANQYGLLGREANSIEPGKRMLSSMSPTIVTRDGKPYLLTGSPGGSTIITTVLQVLVNVLDHEMSVADAVSLPRIHHQWQPDMIMHDAFAISADTKEKLQAMGHMTFREMGFGRGIGDANTILLKDGTMYGMKDPRNPGGAAGF